jgi:hypothetical protein
MQQLSWRFRALALFYHAAFAAFIIGPVVALVGNARVGAYIATGGFGACHLAHRIFAAAGAHMSNLHPWPSFEHVGDAVVNGAYAAALALLLGGLFTAMAGVRTGAYLLLAGLGLQLTIDLIVGLMSYHETMRRPWPQVAPILDDDW